VRGSLSGDCRTGKGGDGWAGERVVEHTILTILETCKILKA
jgi:hypothetical protein